MYHNIFFFNMAETSSWKVHLLEFSCNLSVSTNVIIITRSDIPIFSCLIQSNNVIFNSFIVMLLKLWMMMDLYCIQVYKHIYDLILLLESIKGNGKRSRFIVLFQAKPTHTTLPHWLDLYIAASLNITPPSAIMGANGVNNHLSYIWCCERGIWGYQI